MWPLGRAKPAGLGQRGESLARRHLQRAGLRILAANYRCPAGEADLVALDTSTRAHSGADTVVIVEVKARGDDRYSDPASAVNADKRRRLRRIADYFVTSKRLGDAVNIRFDIVSVVSRPGNPPEVEHIVDAFS